MKKLALTFIFGITLIAGYGYVHSTGCIVRVDCGDGYVKCMGNECSSTTILGGSVTCDGKTTKC